MAYANSADSDQNAPEGTVWSGSTLQNVFASPLSILRNEAKFQRKYYGIKSSKF